YVLKPTFAASPHRVSESAGAPVARLRRSHLLAGHRGAQQHQGQRLRQRRAAGG
ncbi:unnamed protein product, partial [Lampetra planeri]